MTGDLATGAWAFTARDLHRLIALLAEEFDEVIGPVAVDGVIRMRPIGDAGDLPTGITDEQEAGTYRLQTTGSGLHFSYGPGPDSLKAIVHPPRSPVWTMRRSDGTIVVDPADPPTTTRAVIGVRACDLAALDVLGRTQTDGPHADGGFADRRDDLFLVAVDCTHPAPTCLCPSTGDGPVAEHGYDLAITEFVHPHRVFTRHTVHGLVRAGTGRGRAVVERLHLAPATPQLSAQRRAELYESRHRFVREMPDDAASVVMQPDHPRWQEVGERCLTCGNCTAVCPTCFCTDMEDRLDPDGVTATRTKVWDTCFSTEFSHLGDGPHRASPMSRYRHWLTHKVGTWHDQFDESGCVGCGRCITWCPAGIDLTAELEALGRPAEVVA
ncbi:MAG TPA: 4Fe-4S dicluster domain-containing protein [Ilumatobacter sp.]